MRAFSILAVVATYVSICRGQNGTDSQLDILSLLLGVAPVNFNLAGFNTDASFCNSQSSNLPKTLQNPMQTQNKKACKIVWSDSYDGFPPLILTGDCDNPVIIRVDSVTDGTTLRFTCPDASNSFHYYPDNFIDATCKEGKLGPIAIEYLGCETWVRASIKPERKNPPKPSTKCANDIGIVYEIGFEADFSNDIKFFPLISVCFDRNKATTLMTKHTLSYYGKAENNDPPDFRTFTGLFTVAMNTIYTQKSQAYLFSDQRLNLKEQLICNPKYPNTYLQRGHMAPKGDFVTKAEQDATYYYINAMPQWDTINNGNWKGIEDSIRNFLRNENFDLTIYTGGIGVLKLENKKNKHVEVYLSNVYDILDKKKKVPVPSETWKVVHAESLNQAVAFMVSNNPYITKDPKIPEGVNSRCEELHSWLTGIDYPNYPKGFIACFTVEDFNLAFPHISFPSLGAADKNLLKK